MSCCLGYNDEHNVYCGLCDWQRPIVSMEQTEHFLAEHLLASHGRRALYRLDDETGQRTDIPQIEPRS